jgi:two-component system LytT family sensor kinase
MLIFDFVFFFHFSSLMVVQKYSGSRGRHLLKETNRGISAINKERRMRKRKRNRKKKRAFCLRSKIFSIRRRTRPPINFIHYFAFMKKGWYRNKWVTPALHAAFWILFFVLPYLLQPSFRHDHHQPREVPREAFTSFNLVKCFFWMCLFYFNIYVLLPRFVSTKKYFLYFFSLFLCLIFLSLVEIAFFSISEDAGHFNLYGFITFNLFPFLFIIVAGSAYRLFVDRINEEKHSKEREAEHLKSELSFLRSQISPHFMFNVINNIVALARKKSDLVEPSLIQLSQIMRYFLYESNADKVPLEKEVEYLRNYISLQQQRFGTSLKVNFQASGIAGANEIEPMLLIPFVENAFKHSDLKNGSIDIDLKVENNRLRFCVENPFLETDEMKDEVSGIGLVNVQRRLNLLYGKDHVLDIAKAEGKFKIRLDLKLH